MNEPSPVTTEAPGQPSLLFIDATNVQFDENNPRLPANVDGTDPDAVMKWMLEDATLLELMGSIGQQGFFAGEPLLVVKDGDHFKAVEGNRRLAAVRLLLDPESAPARKNAVDQIAAEAIHRPARVAAVEFPSRESILDYLGYRHITGIKEWEPLAKARYLRQLWDVTTGTRDERLRLLARKIGTRPGYVTRLMRGLGLFDAIQEKSFYGIEGLDEDGLSFSLLTTAVSFDNLVSFLGIAEVPAEDTAAHVEGERLEELTRWVYERKDDGRTVLGDSRNLKTLAAVAASDDALDMLRSGLSLDDAAQFSEAPTDSLVRNLRLAYRRLGAAQQVIPRIEDPQALTTDLLEDLILRAEDMLEALRRRQRRAERRGRDA